MTHRRSKGSSYPIKLSRVPSVKTEATPLATSITGQTAQLESFRQQLIMKSKRCLHRQDSTPKTRHRIGLKRYVKIV